MIKRLTLILFLMIALLTTQVQAGDMPSYYSRNNFLIGSSNSYYDGLLGYSNPANLSFLHDGETRFNWNTDRDDFGSFNDWGLFIAVPHLGFGMVKSDLGQWHSTDYQVSLGLGDDKHSFGLAYGWSSHSIDDLANEEVLKISSIDRDIKYMSIGLIGEFSLESKARQGIAEIGIRPLGNSTITLFGDLAIQRKMKLSNAPWSAGAAIEPVPGIHLVGRYFEDEAFTFGLTFDLGTAGVSSQLHYDDDQEHAYTSYSVRVGGMRPSFFPNIICKDRRYLKIDLRGSTGYLKYRFGDQKKKLLLDILRDIDAARNDPRISAIAINLANASIAPEHAWEIRQALQEFRDSGKTVVAFLEYSADRTYYLASVADVVVIEPITVIGLVGYSMSRTYLKGTLEKLGLGFDEWRQFKYKSAAETFSRENMSEADREQFQAYVDDWYETTRDDICKSRGISVGEYEKLLSNDMLMTADGAIKNKLADKIGRWSDVDDIIDDVAGRNLWVIDSEGLYANTLPPKYWGGDPKIAVIYALGDCAMDSGIRARWLSTQLERLKKDGSIEAVVFRVDSPGGDGMASDIVAEALKDLATEKPVIVTQGQVAGSGGYWISMYGDKILAGPNTITGSIGVIGGWIWDKGLSDKLGMTYDNVQRGEHADVLEGVRLPLLGLKVPGRNLTEEERKDVEEIIYEMYDMFVAKVASGRKMSMERVYQLGEGRFYSGLDGKDVGLVDEIGGLMLAIEIAKKDAGISEDQRVELVEVPDYLGWFPFFGPSPVSIGITRDGAALSDDDPGVKYIKQLLESPNMALPLMPPGYYPEAD